MTAKIHAIYGTNVVGAVLDPDDVIEKQLGKFKEVFIMGTTHDEVFFIDSNNGDRARFMLMIEKAKRMLLDLEMGYTNYD